MVDPHGITLLLWADSLAIDFPLDNIPVLFDEKAWKSWGDDLVAATSFAENGAPSTAFYSEWYPWARDVYYTMANYA